MITKRIGAATRFSTGASLSGATPHERPPAPSTRASARHAVRRCREL